MMWSTWSHATSKICIFTFTRLKAIEPGKELTSGKSLSMQTLKSSPMACFFLFFFLLVAGSYFRTDCKSFFTNVSLFITMEVCHQKLFFKLLFAIRVVNVMPWALVKIKIVEVSISDHGYSTNLEYRICGIITVFARMFISPLSQRQWLPNLARW